MKRILLKLTWALFCVHLSLAADPTSTPVRVIRPTLSLPLSQIHPQLQQVDTMCEADGLLYLLNRSESLVYAVNQEGRLAFTVGGQGQGPGEFTAAESLFARGGYLFVLDEDANQINVYTDKGHFKKVIRHGHFAGGRFFVNDQLQATINIPFHEKPIKTIDINERVLQTFGTRLNRKDGNGRNNSRFIFANHDHLIMVPFYFPKLEYYSFQGELINEITLNHLPVMRKRTLAIEQKHEEHKGKYGLLYVSYYSDAVFHENRLYLLMGSDYPPKTLMVLDLEGRRAKLNALFEPALPEGYQHPLRPNTMCINSKGELLMHDRETQTLYLYPLNALD